MNNSNNVNTLLTHLEQEIEWVETLNNLLSAEKEILITRQFDALESLANQKQELSTKLELSASQRLELINNSQSEKANSLSASEFLKKCSPDESMQINKLNGILAEKLKLCRELNMVNGQVITNNLHTRQEIVNALSGNTTDAVHVYTSNGNVSTTNNPNHHQEA